MKADRGTITQAGEVRSARLESLRAIAALGVMVGHIFGQSRNYSGALTLDTFFHRIIFGGGFGVFVFFGLTGYLLFWPFVRSGFGGGSPIDLRRYAVNRVLRIVPLYLAAVAVLLILGSSGGSASQWWRFLTFSQNYSIHTVGTVDGPMWSLVVEVHFYLLLPVLAWALVKLSRNSKLVAAIALVALGVASWFVRRHAIGPTYRRELLEYSLPATFLFFVPGMLMALLRLRWEERRPAWLRGPLAVGDWWLVAAVVVTLIQFDNYNSDTLIALATFFALGACVLPLSRGRLVSALDWRPLATIGVASYSLYVWHDPIVMKLGTISGLGHNFIELLLVAGAICIVVALVSYRLIEAPFLTLRRQWTTPRRTAVSDEASTVVPPSAAEAAVTN